MACPPATARTLKGLSRPSGRRCDRRSRGATTASDTDDASLHGEGQVREDSTPAGETGASNNLKPMNMSYFPNPIYSFLLNET